MVTEKERNTAVQAGCLSGGVWLALFILLFQAGGRLFEAGGEAGGHSPVRLAGWGEEAGGHGLGGGSLALCPCLLFLHACVGSCTPSAGVAQHSGWWADCALLAATP